MDSTVSQIGFAGRNRRAGWPGRFGWPGEAQNILSRNCCNRNGKLLMKQEPPRRSGQGSLSKRNTNSPDPGNQIPGSSTRVVSARFCNGYSYSILMAWLHLSIVPMHHNPDPVHHFLKHKTEHHVVTTGTAEKHFRANSCRLDSVSSSHCCPWIKEPDVNRPLPISLEPGATYQNQLRGDSRGPWVRRVINSSRNGGQSNNGCRVLLMVS